MEEIYIIKKGDQKRYFASNLISEISKKEIYEVAFLIRGFSRNERIGRKEFIVSQEDLQKIKNKDPNLEFYYNLTSYDFYDIIRITITNFIPKGAYLRTDNVPKLRNSRGNIDTFSAVDKQLGNEIVEDNTVYSNRAIFQKQEGSLTIEERDNLLLERDIELDMPLNNPMQHLKVLQDLNNKAIELEEKKLLPSQ